MSLGPVARLACRHEVAAGSIAAFDARLHVIDRQLVRVEDQPTVDAAITVPCEHFVARQGTLPLLDVVCSPRTLTLAPCVKRDCPSVTTCSPSASPRAMTASVSAMRPTTIDRCCAVFDLVSITN